MVSDERRPSVFKYTEIRQMWRFSKLCRHIWGPLLASKLAVQQPSLTSIPLPRWERMKQHCFDLYQNILTEGISLTPTYGSAPSSGGS